MFPNPALIKTGFAGTARNNQRLWNGSGKSEPGEEILRALGATQSTWARNRAFPRKHESVTGLQKDRLSDGKVVR